MQEPGETLSHAEVPGPRAARGVEVLLLELECDRPLAGPTRQALEGIDVVCVGRARRREFRYAGDRALELGVPDSWMSGRHFELRRAGPDWIVQDLGSKNGTRVDGQPLSSLALRRDARILAGHTLLSIRRNALHPTAPWSQDFTPTTDPLDRGATLSPAFAKVIERAGTVAGSQISVLLHGETGTGKEVLARAIHARSGRAGEFVAVNCGSLPPTLVESELFGHRKGAFSGADQNRIGLVRASDGGTLFLDEIGDLPLPAQAALLRVLQQREVLAVGALRPEPVDLRVIAASHRSLPALVREGAFREDLFSRLNGVAIEIPPLRERMDDLPLLIASLARSMLRPDRTVTFTVDAVQRMLSYPWPQNVRELEQALRAGLVLCGAEPLGLEHLPHTVVEHRAPVRPEELTGEDLERRDRLVALLQEHRGNLSAVARAYGKGRTQICRWIVRYGLSPSAFRPG